MGVGLVSDRDGEGEAPHDEAERWIDEQYGDVDCPDCGEQLATNGGCLACLYAYERVVSRVR
jgi:hypothetical protein